jgi:hypothetical protein
MPTDFGNDEPFMWTFFILADGTTLRQHPTNPGRFVPALTVVAKPGHHGNLGVKELARGASLQIPDSIGAFETGIRPIALSAKIGGQARKIWVPGRLIVLAAVLDEDATSNSLANAIHHEVVDHVQIAVNMFVSGLDLAPVIKDSIGLGEGAVQADVDEFLTGKVAEFRQQMTSELTDLAIQVAVREALRKTPPQALVTVVADALDHDELVGVADVSAVEDQLIAGNFQKTVSVDVKPSENRTLPWYILRTNMEGKLTFYPPDIESSTQTGEPIADAWESHTPDRFMVCVPDGPIQYRREFIPQLHDILINYPFCEYRYSIEGKALDGASGSVTFTSNVGLPEFDANGYPFTGMRFEDRVVTVEYRRFVDLQRPQLEHLTLRNDPAHGNYDFRVKVEAVTPNGGVVHVVDEYVSFEGQRIVFPSGFIEGISKCLEPFTSDRYSKSKRVGPKDLWGPEGHESQFKKALELLGKRELMGSSTPERMASVREAVKKALYRHMG